MQSGSFFTSSFGFFFLLVAFVFQDAAASVLSRSDHAATDSHVHRGAQVSIVCVDQAGGEVLVSDQLQVQKELEKNTHSQ